MWQLNTLWIDTEIETCQGKMDRLMEDKIISSQIEYALNTRVKIKITDWKVRHD